MKKHTAIELLEMLHETGTFEGIPTGNSFEPIVNKINEIIEQLNRLTKIVSSRESMKEDTVYEK